MFVVWWALLAYTVNLNAGALWIGLAPTIAVIVNYVLSKRQKEQIAADAKSQVGEVHDLVNNRSEQQDAKISELEGELKIVRAELDKGYSGR